MTNEEMFTTPLERATRFVLHCRRTCTEVSVFNVMTWLGDEYKTEEPRGCPFCGSKTLVHEVPTGEFDVQCSRPSCGYRSGKQGNKDAAILKHNELYLAALQEEGRSRTVLESLIRGVNKND